MNITEKELNKFLDDIVDIHGVTSLNIPELIEEYGEDICYYPYAISVGILMDEKIVDHIPQTRKNKKYASDYVDEYFGSIDIINEKSEKICEFIKNNGYDATYIRLSGKCRTLNLKKKYAQKTTANLAGLGWIGKSDLMITPKFGPRLTWATILTDMPLKIKERIKSRCGDCNICTNICPSNAIEGKYNSKTCLEFINNEINRLGFKMICGMCLYSCPYGRKINGKYLKN
ncbi:MAG: hypothetical protein Q4Q23_01925 [Methanobacteriaceae archaeon]|nr:hypothetical protein [Methanobacteriaceae archaeon]